MQTFDYARSRNAIFELARGVQLTFEKQDLLFKSFAECERTHGMGSKTAIISMMSVIYDGLVFGNWPWTSRVMTDLVTGVQREGK